jgi:SsrA-binding protein
MARKLKPTTKIVAENRKARHFYAILEVLQAGIVLEGTEVKSLRNRQASIAEAYVSVEGGELWLINGHIAVYQQCTSAFNHDERRKRKLLVKRREISKFFRAVQREGMSIVPLKLFFNTKGIAKIDIALAKGKKMHDRRETEKKRDWDRAQHRILQRDVRS